MKIKSLNFLDGVQRQKGFTLIELLVVLGLIVILTSLTLASLVRSQDQQIFSNNFERVYSMVNNARSLAIAGKGQLDYVDFDNDGCKNTIVLPACPNADYATPYNYGIYLNNTVGATGAIKNVTVFADMNLPSDGTGTGQAKGKYNLGTDYTKGFDMDLDTLVLPSDLTMELQDFDGTKSAGGDGSIFFTPNYADLTADNFNMNPYLIIRLKSNINTTLCKQIRIHQLAGIPEVETCSTTY